MPTILYTVLSLIDNEELISLLPLIFQLYCIPLFLTYFKFLTFVWHNKPAIQATSSNTVVEN